MKTFMNLHGLDLVFSGACNMQCEYCYIHKHPERMKEYNGQIREALSNGDYANNIIKTLGEYKEDIEHIGLWGAEPTLNLVYFDQFIRPLLDYYTNCHSIMFSTNALLGLPAIKKAIDSIYNYSIEKNEIYTLTIQFSIDGPAYLNDSSRHKGATDNTIKVIKEVCAYVNDLLEKNDTTFHFESNVKATLSAHWLQYLADNDDKLVEWFDFFDNLQEEALSILNRPDNCSLFFANYPTLVDPGEHTKEDGKSLMAFVKKVAKLDVSRWKHYYHPLFPQLWRGYQHFEELQNEKHSTLLPPGLYSCSAGNSSYSIDYRGRLMSCHRLFDNAYMGMNKHSELFIDSTSTINDISEEKIKTKEAMLAYKDTLFHDYSGTLCRQYLLGYLLRALVLVGDLPQKVLEPEYIKMLMACMGGISCHYGQLDMTGSIYLPTFSYINLLAYGAAETLWAYYAMSGDLNYKQKGHRNEHPAIPGQPSLE